MSNGFRLVFWGLLFVLIDIRIEVFDILPDFIGYILIGSGLLQLGKHEPYFMKARPFSILLIFLALPNFIGYFESNGAGNQLGMLGMVYFFITIILHLLMVYFIFEATRRLAVSHEDEEWAEATKVRWNYYAVINLVFLIAHSFSFNLDPNSFQVVYILLLVAFLIVELAIIVFMKRSERRFES